MQINRNLAIGEYVKDIYILLIIRFIFKGVIFILHLKKYQLLLSPYIKRNFA